MLPSPILGRPVYPEVLLTKSRRRLRGSPPASVWSPWRWASQESVYCRFTTDHSPVTQPSSAPPVVWSGLGHLSLPAASFLWRHSATGGGTRGALERLKLPNHSPPVCLVWSTI